MKQKENQQIAEETERKNLIKITDKPEEKKPKPGPPGFFKKLFYFHYNHIFKNYNDKSLLVEEVKKNPNDYLINMEKAITELYKKKKPNLLQLNFLSDIYHLKKDMIFKGTILRVILDAMFYFPGVFVTLILKSFLKENTINLFSVLMMIALAFYILIIGVLRERVDDWETDAGFITTIYLRLNFYKKLKKSNFKFLEIANTGLINNILYFEIRRVAESFNLISVVVSTPISTAIGFYYVYLQVGYLVWLPLSIFLILLMIKYILIGYSANLRNIYRTISSKRADILNEMISDIQLVKLHSMGGRFKKLLYNVREEENIVLRKIHFLDSIVEYIEFIYPVISAAMTLALYNKVHGTFLDVINTYGIVSVFATSRRGFLSFSTVFYKMSDCFKGIDAMRAFFEKISNKYDKSQISNKKAEEEKPRRKSKEILDMRKQLEEVEKIISQREIKVPNGKEKEELEENEEDKLEELKGVEDLSKSSEDEVEEDESKKIMIKIQDASFFVDAFTPKLVADEILTKNFHNITKEEDKEEAIVIEEISKSLKESERTEILEKIKESKTSLMTKILKNLSMEIKKEECVCIVGSVGSGKRAFFYSLLHELYKQANGEVSINGTVYLLDSKSTCFIKGSIKENILLGSEFNETLYSEILECIQLDLTKFKEGEDFIIKGEGENLTFFEKKKILLARAFYKDSDILVVDEFFDDIQDPEEKLFLFNLTKEYFEDDVMIYASSDIDLIKKSGRIISLFNGKIYEDGAYRELIRKKDSKLFEFISLGKIIEHGENNVKHELFIQKLEERYRRKTKKNKIKKRKPILYYKMKFLREKAEFEFENNKNSNTISENVNERNNNIDDMETKNELENYEKRSIFESLFEIIFSGSCLSKYFLILVLIFTSLSMVVSTLWFGIWSTKLIKLEIQEYFNIYIYISLISTSLFLIAQISLKYYVRKGIDKIYKKSVNGLLRKDLDFFEKLRKYRIIQIFSVDFMTLDDNFVSNLELIVRYLLFTVTGAIILTYATYGFFLIFLIITLALSKKKLQIYTTFNKNMSSTQERYRGKVLGMLVKLVKTIIHLRNIGLKNYYDNKFFKTNAVMDNSGTLLWASAKWFKIRVSVITDFFIIVVYTFILGALAIWPDHFKKNFWLVSFCTSWVYLLVIYSYIVFPRFMSLHNQLMASLRLKYFYSEKVFKATKSLIEKEKYKEIIEIENYNFKYEGTKRILKNLNLKIKKRERVCLIGRNGSGKHSLVFLIMKLIKKNLKNYDEGELLDQQVFKIFGYNIEDIDSFALRKKVMFLTQNPVLFYGTVKTNIDPFEKHTKEDIIRILDFLKLPEVLEKIEKNDEESPDLSIKEEIEGAEIEEMLEDIENKLIEKTEKKKRIKNRKTSSLESIDQSSSEMIGEDVAISSVGSPKNRRKVSLEIEEKKLNLILEESPSENNMMVQDFINQLKREEKDFNLNYKKKLKNHVCDEKNYKILDEFLDLKNTMITQKSIIKILMIAKVILAKPKMLIFEENAMEIEQIEINEYYEILFNVLEKTTFLGILSKMDNLMKFDRMVLMNDGRVIEDGGCLELFRKEGSLVRVLVEQWDEGVFDLMNAAVKKVMTKESN